MLRAMTRYADKSVDLAFKMFEPLSTPISQGLDTCVFPSFPLCLSKPSLSPQLKCCFSWKLFLTYRLGMVSHYVLYISEEFITSLL